jgi:L-alanine-DL-glutamate epimerase-like enolase superfamily enzyme
MPTVRINDDNEAEGLGEATAGGLKGEVARVASNVTLADHIGKFVAGEITHKFAAETLTDRLKGKNAIHVSISWG